MYSSFLIIKYSSTMHGVTSLFDHFDASRDSSNALGHLADTCTPVTLYILSEIVCHRSASIYSSNRSQVFRRKRARNDQDADEGYWHSYSSSLLFKHVSDCVGLTGTKSELKSIEALLDKLERYRNLANRNPFIKRFGATHHDFLLLLIC